MANFNEIRDYFDFFKHKVLKGNIKLESDKGEECANKITELLSQIIKSCDNEFHNEVMFGIFCAGFSAGATYLCRICKEHKPDRDD